MNTIRSRGGLYDPTAGLKDEFWLQIYMVAKLKLERLRDHAQIYLYDNGMPARLEFEFILQIQFGAFATTGINTSEEKIDFIGINFGSLLTLVTMHLRVLADPSNFPNIGDCSLETYHEEGDFLHTNVILYQTKMIAPQCEVRMHYAIELALTSLEYLFLHETTHLRHGHVDLLQSKLSGGLMIESATEKQNSPFSKIVSQALEMDADAGATIRLFRLKLEMSGHAKAQIHKMPPVPQAVVINTLGTHSSIIRTISYAVYFMFSLYEPAAWNRDTQDKISHPTIPFRAHAFGNVLELAFGTPRLLEGRLNMTPNEVHHIFKDAILTAESACSRISGNTEPSAISRFYEKLSDVESYIEDLAAAWTSVRASLLPYVRGGELAP
jgi:hypothetical protein